MPGRVHRIWIAGDQRLGDGLHGRELPARATGLGFGDPSQQPSFHVGDARNDHIIRVYWQDRWRVTSRLNLNYGLAYHYETNFTNDDLSKPDYLLPILGTSGLAPTKNDPNNFAP